MVVAASGRKAGVAGEQRKSAWLSNSLMDRLSELEKRREEAEARKQKPQAKAPS
jgi:hypothetical protein